MPSAFSWHMPSAIMYICPLTILLLSGKWILSHHWGACTNPIGLDPLTIFWHLVHVQVCTMAPRLHLHTESTAGAIGCRSTLSWSSSKWELRVSRMGLPRWEIYPLQMDTWQGVLSEAIVILPDTSPLVSHLVQMHCKLIGALLEPMDKVFHLVHLHICESSPQIANIIPIHLHSLLVAHFSMINSMNYLLCKVESSLS